MTNQEIKQKVKQLETEIQALQEESARLFKSELAALMRAKKVSKVKMGVNNHEFNDGDATYFSLYWEDLTITMNDGRERESHGDENKDLELVRKKFITLFSNFQSIFEMEFGGAYEEVVFKVVNGQLKSE